MGSYRAYDDSNLPCLLSLAYLKFIPEDEPLYLNTRRFILS
jgi:meiotically up-regulated gene 157 (Mug157) protein